MRFSPVLLVLLCCFACKQQIPVKIIASHDFVIVDTTIPANAWLHFDEPNNDFPIYYLGPRADTIAIGEQYWFGKEKKWNEALIKAASFRYAEKNLQIVVDTAVHSNLRALYLSDTGYEINEDSTINYNAFIFSIRNNGDSTLFMGISQSLLLMWLEAKSHQGQWLRLGKRIVLACGTGLPAINLRPDEIILAKMRRYRGNIVTDFRLAFQRGGEAVYSNIFKDSIDERTLVLAYRGELGQ